MTPVRITPIQIIHKHDIEANWLLLTDFIPGAGETIVYDAEIDAEGNPLALPSGRTAPYTFARTKIGDGITNLHRLPFSVSWRALSACQEEVIFFGGTAAEHIPVTEILEGDGAEYYTTAPAMLSFRSTAPLNEFQEVQLNGETVDPSNYTLEEGSTIVKFSPDYLNTLSIGSHEVAIVSNKQTTKGTFTIDAPVLNEYGFYYNMPYFCEFYGLPNPEYLSDPENNEEYIWGMSNLAIVFMADGSVKKIDFGADEIENTDEVTLENGIITFHHELLCFNGRFSNDGTAIVTDQVFGALDSFLEGYTGPGLTMSIMPQKVAADDTYFYLIHDDYAAFGVLDKTKKEYPKVRSYIYNTPVRYAVYGTFSGNTQLTEIPTLPDMFSATMGNMFGDCTSLTHVSLPEGVTWIEDYTFTGCSALTQITLPSTLDGLGNHAFVGCNNLETIIFTGTVEQWNTLSLLPDWNRGISAQEVQCINGIVNL